MSEKINDIDKIASICSDCGNCLFSCPVYNAELTEPNSPRGKINIIKALRDGRLEPNKRNQQFVYQCALCGSCENICTKGVAYTEMMINHRVTAAKGSKIPLLKKIILFLYQSILFKKMVWVTDLLAHTPLQKVLGIPRRRKSIEKKRKSNSQAEYDVLLFPGCVLTMFYPAIIEDITRIMEQNGLRVVTPSNLQCCGFPFLSQGWKNKFLTLRQKNQKIFSEYKFKYIVVPCGTGTITFKEHYQIENPEIEIYELTDFFYKFLPNVPVDEDKLKPTGTKNGKFTWHDPCHNLKSLKIDKAPRHFMNKLGSSFIDDKSALCCGFGGIFSVGFPSTSKKILKRKENKLEEIGADTVVTACPGCYLQLRERSNLDKRILFFSDLFH